MSESRDVINLIDWQDNSADDLRFEAMLREGDPLTASIRDCNLQLEEAEQVIRVPRIGAETTIESVRESKALAEARAARLTANIETLRSLLFVTSDNIASAPYSMLGKDVVHNPSKAEYMARQMDNKMTASIVAHRIYKKRSLLDTAMRIADVAAEEYDRDPLNPQPDYMLRRERRTFR